MYRIIAFAAILFPAIPLYAQTAPQSIPVSDPLAISFAQKAMLALAGGKTVTDVTLNGNVISIAGSENESGTGTFSAKGTSESRVDLNLSNGTRSEVRTFANGNPSGGWKANAASPKPYVWHNCWTDAAWFFPALSSLAQTNNVAFIFKYVGQEQHSGVAAQHIRVFQSPVADPMIQQLSTMDFYLDEASFLPLAIRFTTHPDNDMMTNISLEADFANYRSVNGIEIPFHFAELSNGVLTLDVTVTNVQLDTGLADIFFSL